MIVSLDELKRVLGIALDNTAKDDDLTRIILAKTIWVEGVTHRRFDTPVAHTQYEDGGTEQLFFEWHVDAGATVVISRRPRLEKFRDWEELVINEDWERRDQAVLFLRAWQVWPLEDEVRLVYPGGYATPPEDIKDVILELAMKQYMLDLDTSSGTSRLTSESLGDYSYSASSDTAAGSSITSISALGQATINRYKRRFV